MSSYNKPQGISAIMSGQKYSLLKERSPLSPVQQGVDGDYKIITKRDVSIQQMRVVNNTAYIKQGKLELPPEITDLIDNKAYMNRHRKLARDYGVIYLSKLAELARTKAKPSRWYAACTSLANWKKTEAMLSKLMAKLGKLKERLQAIDIDMNYLPYFYKASLKLSEYKLNRCIELATSRGVSNRKNYFAKAIATSLAELKKTATV